jgi:transposase
MTKRFPSRDQLEEFVGLLQRLHDEAEKLDPAQRVDWNYARTPPGDPFLCIWYSVRSWLLHPDFEPPHLGWPDRLSEILSGFSGFSRAFDKHRGKALYVLREQINEIRSSLSEQATGAGDGEWMTPTEAVKWADEIGIKIHLSTMSRWREKERFISSDGDASCRYKVELESFDRWVREWDRNGRRLRPKSKSRKT